MKKILRKILPFMSAVILVSCGTNSSSSEPGENSAASALPEKVVHVESDIIVYSDLTSLLNSSDLIVVGEYSADTEQKIIYEYNPEFGKEVIVDGESTNRIHILKVLKGNPSSDEVNVVQRYIVQDDPEQLVTFSSLTPMIKGDKWLFFLRYDKDNDEYWCAGDYCGRYPVPNEEIKSELEKLGDNGLLDCKTLGVYDNSANNTYLYRDIIEYFGDSLTE